MKTGIIVAMDKEFAQLKALLTDAATEHSGHRDFVTGRLGKRKSSCRNAGSER